MRQRSNPRLKLSHAARTKFAFAAGHRRIAISLLAGTLNYDAALSIAAGFVRRLDLAQPDGFAGRFCRRSGSSAEARPYPDRRSPGEG
jgi:hypothetical protein